MIKKVKKIVACTLIASSFSAIQMGNTFMTTKAYAASDFNLRSIYLSDGEMNFSADVRNYDIKVDGDVDKIRITAKPDCTSAHYDEYKVDIDGAIVDETDNFRAELPLLKGENEIKVRIENEDGKKKVYTLNITRGRLDSDTYGDEIYLKDIYLDYGDLYIDFDKDVTSYNVEVEETMDQIAINGIPEDSDDTVRINGSIVKENGDKDDDKKNTTKDYKKIVKLEKGKNVVEIEIGNDDNQKIYKVNITRGKVTNSTNNAATEKNTNTTTSNQENNTNTTIATTNKENSNVDTTEYNKWVQENGVWKYNDETGVPLKNKWFNDKSNGAWYYLGEDGSIKTGWQAINNNWYYLDSSGAMKTGWQAIGSDWYFLNSDGIMKTGWMIGNDGKYYNLQPSGKMSKDTVVDGYKVGTDGAWFI